MANLGRTISGVNTLSDFTAKVVYAASDRYGTTQFNQTFQAGKEYTGVNFFKGLNRPPKLRILSIFQPLISGQVNATNDTYVAFQVYDYTLSAWRGPWCRRAQANDSWTYVDYFVTTIDSFGRKYGNYYTGTGSSVSTFTPPTALFVNKTNLYLTTLGRSITVIGGHSPSTFVLSAASNKMYHFHGFLTLDGYTGTWCFYSISANGNALGFNHLLDAAPYNTGTYPNVLPYTNKFSSEWRIATVCNITTNLGYTPRISMGNTGLGPIKYHNGPVPETAFPGGINGVDLFDKEVWCTYDPGNPATFFLTPLWGGGSTTEESEQGVEGTGAGSYAEAGWYGTSAEDSYAYWNGSSWVPNTYSTYSSAPSSTEFTYFGWYQSLDPISVCTSPPEGPPNTAYYETASGFGPMTQLFYDSALQSPIGNFAPSRLYYNQSNNVVFRGDPQGRVEFTFKC